MGGGSSILDCTSKKKDKANRKKYRGKPIEEEPSSKGNNNKDQVTFDWNCIKNTMYKYKYTNAYQKYSIQMHWNLPYYTEVFNKIANGW